MCYFVNRMFLDPVYNEFYIKPNLNTTYPVSYMVYWTTMLIVGFNFAKSCWMNSERVELSCFIWSDEASFKLSGHYVNRHNCTYLVYREPQHFYWEAIEWTWCDNFWVGISCRGVIGPYFFDGTMTGEKYLEMLTNFVIPGLQLHIDNFNSLISFNMMKPLPIT